jgi:tetratricopeptide (TPR) repeat protein
MLQTLRQYAFEQLQACGELEATLHRHARYYLLLAQRAQESDEHSRSSLQVLLPELEEVRIALRRCVELDERELGLRLASATWRMWQAAGHYAEGRGWLSCLLEAPGPGAAIRADALMALAGLAYWQADYPAAWTAYEEALALYRTTGDRASEAEVLNALSMTATWRGDPAKGAELAIEARTLFEALGTRSKVGQAIMAQGFALWQEHRYADARPFWEDALAISRELGDDTLAVTQLAAIAGLEFHTGATADATRIALDALDQACDLENTGLCVWLLEFAAAFAVADRPREALRVAAAADALRTASGGGKRVEELHIEPARSAARRYLDPVELERAWTDGRTLDLEAAVGAARQLRP